MITGSGGSGAAVELFPYPSGRVLAGDGVFMVPGSASPAPE